MINLEKKPTVTINNKIAGKMLYSEMFPLGKDNTDYKKINGDFVSSSSINGRDTLIVSSDALTVLAEHAFRDISHLLRPSHLAQLRAILDDKSASEIVAPKALDVTEIDLLMQVAL